MNRPENNMDVQPWRPLISDSANLDYEFSSSSGYTHNTYHGPTKHYRPMLNSLTGSQLVGLQPEEQRPLRFTDSPQHHPNLAPNPSPRRKSSSTSNDGSEQLYAPYDRVGTIYIPGEYHGCGQNEGSTHCLGCCIRPDGYRAETNLGFNYGMPAEHTYTTTGYGSEYSGSGLYGYATDYAYDNPSSMSSGSRTPQRLPPTHRRTPSNVSNASSTTTSGSNVNPSFRLEDEPCIFSTPVHYHRRPEYDYGIGFSRQNSHDSTNSERPTTLETGITKLRSSLKRNNYQVNSGGNTPTNPTPPDSLTSDDSSYVSAKDSNSSMSRVRFSPETLLDLPVPGQTHDPTLPLPLQVRRTRQRPPLSPELEREFLS